MNNEQWDIEYMPFATSPSTRAHLYMPVLDTDETIDMVRERFDLKFGNKQGWQFVDARKGMF